MPYTFTVNGIERSTEEDKPLLRYLRDDLRLYSVKDGCSEGACGTCTIIVDGRAMRSCILTTEKAAGKITNPARIATKKSMIPICMAEVVRLV